MGLLWGYFSVMRGWEEGGESKQGFRHGVAGHFRAHSVPVGCATQVER